MSSDRPYPYVYWHEPTKRWFGRLRVKGQLVHLGFFEDIQDAIKAVNAFCQEFNLAKTGEELRALRARRSRQTSVDKLRESLRREHDRVSQVFEED